MALADPGSTPPFPSPAWSTHHVFQLRQPTLPAVVEEAKHNDDEADDTNDHQHHKESPVVTAHLGSPRLATAGGGVVLDANLGVWNRTSAKVLRATNIGEVGVSPTGLGPGPVLPAKLLCLYWFI